MAVRTKIELLTNLDAVLSNNRTPPTRGADLNIFLRDLIDSNPNGYISSNNTLPISFAINSSEKMRILNSGNVGIGTTTPTTKLEVNGDLKVSGVNGTFSTENVQSNLYALNLSRSSTSLTTVGNVGIGTTSPIAKTHIDKATQTIGATTPSGAFVITDLSGSNFALELGTNTANGNWIQSRNATSATFYNLLLNPSGGNVGIGISNGTKTLSVNGTIGFGSFASKDLQTELDKKQNLLSGSGFVKVSGNTISYDTNSYLTGIIGSDVTTALGYTPYNATNPNGYITSGSLSTIYAPKINPIFSGSVTLSAYSGLGTSKILALDNNGKIIASVIPDNITDVAFNIDGENVLSVYQNVDLLNPNIFLLGQIGTKTISELRFLSDCPYKIIFVSDLNNFFYFDSVDTTSSDDGINIIVTSGGKRFKSLKLSISQITSLQSSLNNKASLTSDNSFSGSNYFSGSETSIRSSKEVSAGVQRYDSTVLARPEFISFYYSYNESISVLPKSNSVTISPIDTQTTQPIKFMGSSKVIMGSGSTSASVAFEITSTSQGFLLPRMTTTQINAISSPIEGLEVYNSTLHTKCYYNGTQWRKVTDATM